MGSQDNDPLRIDSDSVSKLIPTLKGKMVASQPPEWLAFIQGKVGRKLEPFEGTTYEELVTFVLGGLGISEKRFNKGSAKWLRSLFLELERDINLARETTPEGTRIIYRFGNNAVGVIFDPVTWEGFYEFGRVIIETGTMILHSKPKPQGCRETALRRTVARVLGELIYLEEPPTLTMIRGMIQEPGVAIHEDDLIPISSPSPAAEPHDSTVYLCNARYKNRVPKLLFKSVVASYVYGIPITATGAGSLSEWPEVCTRVRRDGDIFLVEDEGVLLMYEVLPLPEHLIRTLKAKMHELNM